MIRSIDVKFKGINEILLNNPETVDPLHPLAKEKKNLTNKRVKTDEIHAQIRDLEIRSKIYWQNKIVIPSAWVIASIAANSWGLSKISKAKIRGAVFITEAWLDLKYDGIKKVKKPLDIVKNDEFHHVVPIKQGQVKIVKAYPSFKDWGFECCIEYDDTIIQEDDIKTILSYVGKYGGFGDFRPTYGRCEVEYG